MREQTYYGPYLLAGEDLWQRADFVADPAALDDHRWQARHTSIKPGHATPDDCELFAGIAYLTNRASLLLAYCPDCYHHGFGTDLLRMALADVARATWAPRAAPRRRIAASLTLLLSDELEVAVVVECRQPWLDFLEELLGDALQHIAPDSG